MVGVLDGKHSRITPGKRDSVDYRPGVRAMIRVVSIVLLSVLVILTRTLTSDIGTAVAEGPGGGRGSGSERGGNGGGGAAAAAGGAGIAGGREDQPGTRTDLPGAIAQAARDAARHAVDASREAFQSAEAAARAANSALSEAALVVRRETNRARTPQRAPGKRSTRRSIAQRCPRSGLRLPERSRACAENCWLRRASRVEAPFSRGGDIKRRAIILRSEERRVGKECRYREYLSILKKIVGARKVVTIS